ncbi:histone lysine methyltransferase Set9 [Blastocladiella emersonii ATCC 22665]|nr:histone lysine methyltransferase Set9 [Blastocladiella emersonii ATCC 22665]
MDRPAMPPPSTIPASPAPAAPPSGSRRGGSSSTRSLRSSGNGDVPPPAPAPAPTTPLVNTADGTADPAPAPPPPPLAHHHPFAHPHLHPMHGAVPPAALAHADVQAASPGTAAAGETSSRPAAPAGTDSPAADGTAADGANEISDARAPASRLRPRAADAAAAAADSEEEEEPDNDDSSEADDGADDEDAARRRLAHAVASRSLLAHLLAHANAGGAQAALDELQPGLLPALPSSRALAAYDDVCTHIMLDCIHLGFRTRKMDLGGLALLDTAAAEAADATGAASDGRGGSAREWWAAMKRVPYELVRAPHDFPVPADTVCGVLRQYIAEELSLSMATHMVIAAIPWLERWLREDMPVPHIRHFCRHLQRYIAMYSTAAGFDMVETRRYDRNEAPIAPGIAQAALVAVREWSTGDELLLCGGRVAPLSHAEEEALQVSGRDFSVLLSRRSGEQNLFLGPARFVNHDCRPNLVFVVRVTGEVHFRATRAILPGQELTVSYGADYFGIANQDCLCATCERTSRGMFGTLHASASPEPLGAATATATAAIGESVDTGHRPHHHHHHPASAGSPLSAITDDGASTSSSSARTRPPLSGSLAATAAAAAAAAAGAAPGVRRLRGSLNKPSRRACSSSGSRGSPGSASGSLGSRHSPGLLHNHFSEDDQGAAGLREPLPWVSSKALSLFQHQVAASLNPDLAWEEPAMVPCALCHCYTYVFKVSTAGAVQCHKCLRNALVYGFPWPQRIAEAAAKLLRKKCGTHSGGSGSSSGGGHARGWSSAKHFRLPPGYLLHEVERRLLRSVHRDEPPFVALDPALNYAYPQLAGAGAWSPSRAVAVAAAASSISPGDLSYPATSSLSLSPSSSPTAVVGPDGKPVGPHSSPVPPQPDPEPPKPSFDEEWKAICAQIDAMREIPPRFRKIKWRFDEDDDANPLLVKNYNQRNLVLCAENRVWYPAITVPISDWEDQKLEPTTSGFHVLFLNSANRSYGCVSRYDMVQVTDILRGETSVLTTPLDPDLLADDAGKKRPMVMTAGPEIRVVLKTVQAAATERLLNPPPRSVWRKWHNEYKLMGTVPADFQHQYMPVANIDIRPMAQLIGSRTGGAASNAAATGRARPSPNITPSTLGSSSNSSLARSASASASASTSRRGSRQASPGGGTASASAEPVAAAAAAAPADDGDVAPMDVDLPPPPAKSARLPRTAATVAATPQRPSRHSSSSLSTPASGYTTSSAPSSADRPLDAAAAAPPPTAAVALVAAAGPRSRTRTRSQPTTAARRSPGPPRSVAEWAARSAAYSDSDSDSDEEDEAVAATPAAHRSRPPKRARNNDESDGGSYVDDGDDDDDDDDEFDDSPPQRKRPRIVTSVSPHDRGRVVSPAMAAAAATPRQHQLPLEPPPRPSAPRARSASASPPPPPPSPHVRLAQLEVMRSCSADFADEAAEATAFAEYMALLETLTPPPSAADGPVEEDVRSPVPARATSPGSSSSSRGTASSELEEGELPSSVAAAAAAAAAVAAAVANSRQLPLAAPPLGGHAPLLSPPPRELGLPPRPRSRLQPTAVVMCSGSDAAAVHHHEAPPPPSQ